MEPARLLPIIAVGEGVMLAAAIAGARAAGLPLDFGPVPLGIAAGIAAALALALVNLVLLRSKGNRWPGAPLRYVCRVVVRPLFEHVTLAQIVLVSALAGLGEELLFRGVLQPLVGLPAASLLFGVVHVGGRALIGYGAWAACIGVLFGLLMEATGGLLAPVLAHGLYDALALAYVRYRPGDVCED